MKSKILSCGLTLILSGAFVSCGQYTHSSESNLLGLSNSKLIWSDSDISICFDEAASTSPDFDALMVGSIESMNASYNKATTGVSFSGLKKCSQDSNVDAVIIFKTLLASGNEGLLGISASIGTGHLSSGIPEVDQAFAGRFGIQIKSNEGVTESFKFTLLHELGHMVGLYHEHAHNESTCNITSERTTDTAGLPFELAADAYQNWGTAYDNKSIMNYCVGEALTHGYSMDSINSFVPQVASLSQCDAAVLKHIYSGASIPSACTTDSSVKKPSANPGFPGQPIDPNLGFPVDPNQGFPLDPNLGFPVDPSLGFPIPNDPFGTLPGTGNGLPSCLDINFLSQNAGICVTAAGQCHIFNYGYPERPIVGCSL